MLKKLDSPIGWFSLVILTWYLVGGDDWFIVVILAAILAKQVEIIKRIDLVTVKKGEGKSEYKNMIQILDEVEKR